MRGMSPWRAWSRLLVGIGIYGSGVSAMIRGRLGLGPWDLLHQGIFVRTGISIGTATVLVGLAIFVVLWPFGVRPGWGSLVNMVLIGVVIDLTLPYLHAPASLLLRLGYHLAGIAMLGFGTGLYVSAGMGAGPRDSLMLTSAVRSGWPVRRVRTLIEIVVGLLGWLLGGTLGLGTILFALLIGPAVQWSLHVCGAPAGRPRPVVAGDGLLEAAP